MADPRCPSLSGIIRAYQCPLCHGELEDPRVLPCDHVICLHCLRGHGGPPPLSCPTCTCAVDCSRVLQEDTIAGLPKAVVLSSLRASLQKELLSCAHSGCETTTSKDHEQLYVNRKSSDGGRVTQSCEELQQSKVDKLTGGRRKRQKKRATTLLPAAESSTISADGASPVGENVQTATTLDTHICKEHHFAQYCCTCAVAICTKCCATKHKGHTLEDVAQAAAEFKAEMDSVQRATDRHITTMSSEVDDLKATSKDIRKDMAEARRMVQKVSDKICERVGQQRKALLDQITLLEKDACDRAAVAREERLERIKKIQSWHLLVQVLSKTNYDLVAHAPTVRENLTKLGQAPIVNQGVRWHSHISTSSTGSLPGNLIGTLQARQGANCGKEFKKSKLTVHIPAVNAVKLEFRSAVTGIATTGSHVFVTHYHHGSISVLRPDGAAITSIAVPGLEQPQGVAVVDRAPSPCIVISDHNSKLHFATLSKSGQSLVTCGSVLLSYQPSGVSVSSNSHVVVTAPTLKKIFVHDSTGTVLKTVNLATLVWPLYAEVCPSGKRYLVTDSRRVVIVNGQGKELQTNTGGPDAGKHMGALQAVQDSRDSVIVVDINRGCLHRLTAPDLKFQNFVLEDSCNSPRRVALDEAAGLLYVACGGYGDRRLDIYKYSYAEPHVIELKLELNTKV